MPKQTQAVRPGMPDATLHVMGFRVVDATTGELLHKASFQQPLAERRAEALVKKGVAAIVERTDGKAI